jgi:hypothetical protein
MITRQPKWCNGPCGRELPAEAFYDLGPQLSAYCKRCDNIRRVETFKARYSSPRARLLYLRAQRLRRRRRAIQHQDAGIA